MQILEPKVILLASTHMDPAALDRLKDEIGAHEYPSPGSNGEALIEVGGRLCYRSFQPGLNKNVTKVRTDSFEYIKNILAQKHGSVLEHATVTFVILNCSRVFTHEVVRHRAGVAISQESMRYVRLDNIGMYYPQVFGSQIPDKILQAKIRQIFERVVRTSEIAIEEISQLLGIDDVGKPFDFKKKVTSAMRRLAPGGHTTNIMLTANHRAWRHILKVRTGEGVEEEMWPIMKEIGSQLKASCPLIYQDMFLDIDPTGKRKSEGWKFEFDKV